MKHIIIGFMLLALAKLLESWGDAGATASERLPGHLLALGALIVAGVFFVRAILAAARR